MVRASAEDNNNTPHGKTATTILNMSPAASTLSSPPLPGAPCPHCNGLDNNVFDSPPSSQS